MAHMSWWHLRGSANSLLSDTCSLTVDHAEAHLCTPLPTDVDFVVPYVQLLRLSLRQSARCHGPSSILSPYPATVRSSIGTGDQRLFDVYL